MENKNIKVEKRRRIVGQTILYLFDAALDKSIENAAIVWKNLSLFLGSCFFLIGLFGFETSRYCDGNSAEYLSCTRPSAYYYYSGFDITLIVLGAALVMIWFLKRKTGDPQ